MSKRLYNLKAGNARRASDAAKRRAYVTRAKWLRESYRDGFHAGARGVIRHLYGAATVAENTFIGIILYRKPRDLTPAEHSAPLAPALDELNRLGILHMADEPEKVYSEAELAKLDEPEVES